MSTGVRLEVADGVATVVLEGADRLNAFSADTARQLSEAYRACDRDDAVRVVVVTGAGRAFCAGADLSADAFAVREQFTASPIDPPAWQVRKLVIAAVNGHAIGIGFTLALECDLRIVSETAKLAVPQVRRGMVGDCASHWTVSRLAGRGVAADLLLTGRTLTGAEALGMGLANRAVAAEQVLPTALELAHEVAREASPASVALSKQILWSDAGLAGTVAAEDRAHRILMDHPDAAEGPRAWRERRAPRWRLGVSELPATDLAEQR